LLRYVALYKTAAVYKRVFGKGFVFQSAGGLLLRKSGKACCKSGKKYLWQGLNGKLKSMGK
jgi:hypothetical protein